MYKRTSEHAKEIRDELKSRFGYTRKQVSVRTSIYAGGSSIRITINDPAVPMSRVKQVAEAHESVSRCEITGEILSGGNRYVTVWYGDDALEEFQDDWMGAVQAAQQKVHDNYLIRIGDTPLMLGRRGGGGMFTLWSSESSSMLKDSWTLGGIAIEVGKFMVEHKERRIA